MKLLVHASGSANDAHLIEEIPAAIEMAREAGVVVEAVKTLSEMRERLLVGSGSDVVDGALSADNTARINAAVVRYLDPIKLRDPETGAEEPLKSPLAAILPSAKKKHPFILSDAGAHTDNTPRSIAAGALLCGSFWRIIYGKQYPRYGVYGFGEEVSKLPANARAAYELLRQYEKRVVRIVEAKEIFAGDVAEVLIVRNGEIGNTILKTAEATIAAFGTVMREEVKAEFFAKIGGGLVKPAFQRARERFYHDDAHGAFFLGPTKPVMKHHGRLGADELFLAIQRLAIYVQRGFIPRAREDFLSLISKTHPGWIE